MDAAAYAPAYAAATRAAELAQSSGTDKERALTQALLTRYTAEAPEDRSALDAAWADAIAGVADQFPDDDEIQAMAAESIMDLSPWVYWMSDGVTPVGRAQEAMDRLETVLARNPAHAPSIHLYIHMTEASADPWRAAAPADVLLTLAPAAGHMVHMPSHTYYRIGRFKDSLQSNIDAVVADEALLAEVPGSDLYRFGYYPHNIHFALTSAQMAGDAETAIEMAGKLDIAVPLEMATVAPWVQPIKAAPWYARAQFADPESVLADPGISDPTLPYLTAAWRYARGEALAKLGRRNEVLDEAAAIGVLRETGDFSPLGTVPAADILRVMELVLAGRAATLAGDHPAAITAYSEATELQANLAYTEPPYWWYPVRQSLAAALLRDGQAERAELEFYRTLIESPNNGWAYWGLAQARRAMGDRRGARDAEAKWRDAWAGDRGGMSLERL
jgi:tetratricopeptide (TPR) repeat protein